MVLKINMLLAKAGPVREIGKTSMKIYLGRKSKQSGFTVLIPARELEEIRTCEGSNMEIPRPVEKEEVLQALKPRSLCRLW